MIPNADRDAPSNRQEAISLLSWFSGYESQFTTIDQNNEDALKKLYQLGLHELIR